jgi:hypothetical protein
MLFLFIFLLAIPFLIIAQVDSTGYEQPGSFLDILTNFKVWLATPAAVAGVTIFLTWQLGLWWKTITKVVKQISAIVIALIVVTIGNLLNWGFMAEFDVPSTISYGIIIGFMANGWFVLGKNIKRGV